MNSAETGRGMCPAEQELKADMPPRVNVAEAARQIKRTFIYSNLKNPFPFADLESEYTRDEAIGLYADRKDERYGLVAILNGVVIDVALEQRRYAPPFGLIGQKENEPVKIVEKFDEEDPFEELYDFAGGTLDAVRLFVIDFAEAKFPKYVQKTIDRLKDWDSFCAKNLEKKFSDGGYFLTEDTSTYLHGPFNREQFVGHATGMRVMCGVLEMIPELVDRDLGRAAKSPELLRDIAANSYPLIAQRSMLDHHASHGVEEVLYGERKDQDYEVLQSNLTKDFLLVPYGDSWRVELNDEVWTSAQERLTRYPNKAGETKTGGCPVMAKIKGESPMKKLYEWMVDVAAEIYKQQYSK